MIEHVSLAWSFRITALICGVFNPAAVALIRNRNNVIKPPSLGFDTMLLRRYDVLIFLAWGFFSMLGCMTMIYSLPDFAISIGLESNKAATLSAYLNLGIAGGRTFLRGLVIGRGGLR